MSQTDLTNEGKINEFMNGLLKYINRKAISDMSNLLLTSQTNQLKREKREAARKEREKLREEKKRRRQQKSSAKKK